MRLTLGPSVAWWSFWGLGLVKITKLNFDKHAIWILKSNYFGESTKPLAPMCLWQCLLKQCNLSFVNNKYNLRNHFVSDVNQDVLLSVKICDIRTSQVLCLCVLHQTTGPKWTNFAKAKSEAGYIFAAFCCQTWQMCQSSTNHQDNNEVQNEWERSRQCSLHRVSPANEWLTGMSKNLDP